MRINTKNKRLKIFTWHVHGSYLYSLSKCDVDFFIPYKKNRPENYLGKIGNFPWGKNIKEVAFEDVKELEFDCILFQAKSNYDERFEIFSPSQRNLPKIYLEHNPPREHPTDTQHPVDSSEVVLVHVTFFNDLMWDNGRTPTIVIEHGVEVPKVSNIGDYKKGIVLINNLAKRGRRLGSDIFEEVRKYVPLDLYGMASEEIGGLGEIPHDKLAEILPHYRFFFNPIRYTSLGLSVCEAMMFGLPIIGLSTTAMPQAIENNVSGFIDSDINFLVKKMSILIDNKEKAQKLGKKARKIAFERFNIKRFVKEWQLLFETVVNKPIYIPKFHNEAIGVFDEKRSYI